MLDCFILDPNIAFFVIPFLIFLSRIIDVSIGTMRLIFISRGYKLFAAVCGFFEVLIWLVAITQVMNNLTNVATYLMYALGFASGNFIGMVIEEKIALGRVLLRIITTEPVPEIKKYFKEKECGFTVVNAEGRFGDVQLVFTILKRQELEPVIGFLHSIDPNIFYTIEDIRSDNTMRLSPKKASKLRPGRLFLQRSRRKAK